MANFLIIFSFVLNVVNGIKTLLPAHNRTFGTIITSDSGKIKGIDIGKAVDVKRFKDSMEFLNHSFTPSALTSSQTVIVPRLPNLPKGLDDFGSNILSHKNSLLLYIIRISQLIASSQSIYLPLDFELLQYHSLKSQLPVQLLVLSLALIFKLNIPIRTLNIEVKPINSGDDKFQKLVELRLLELIREVEKAFNAPTTIINIRGGDFIANNFVDTPFVTIANYLCSSLLTPNATAQSPALVIYRNQLNQLELKLMEEFQNEIETLVLDDLAENLQDLVNKFQREFMALAKKNAPKHLNHQSLLYVVHRNFTNRMKYVADGMLAYAILQGGYYPKHSILKNSIGRLVGFAGGIFPFWLMKLIRRFKFPLSITFSYLSPDAFGLSNYFQSCYFNLTPDRINYYSSSENI